MKYALVRPANYVHPRRSTNMRPLTLPRALLGLDHMSPIMELSQLAVPSVYGLILILGYPSQWLLMYLDPEPLTKNELLATNIVLVLIFITYTKSVFVDPGTIPMDWADKQDLGNSNASVAEKEATTKSKKWCRKCDAAKPPRAHHCKACKRYR